MNKKNILLVTAFFYPQNVIATSRVGQWAKYWAKDGHNVFVLTTKKYPFWPLDYRVELPSNISVIETDYLPKFIAKKTTHSNIKSNGFSTQKEKNTLRSLKNKINYLVDIDIHDLWPLTATKEGSEIIKNNKIDIIISSFSPASSHMIASKLKKENPDIRWIADFRDLWFDNHTQSQSTIGQFIRKAREKSTIKKADVLITVSQPLADTLSKNHPKKQVVVIENGYDLEEYSSYKDIESSLSTDEKPFTITYTGMIYPGKRDPSPLFTAINSLIEENKITALDIQVEFYGSTKSIIDDLVESETYNKHGYIKNHGIIPRNESIKKQINTDLLLLLEWNDPSANGVLTGKVFEYIASGTPILGIGITKETNLGKLLESTGTGISTNNIREIKEIILRAIISRKFDFHQPNLEKISLYRRDNQARKVISL